MRVQEKRSAERMPTIRVLFVCVGNICRSPTAEGVFRKMLEQRGLSGWLEVDSAGTTAYHEGEPPDLRAQRAARARGYDLSGMIARCLGAQDFEAFDLILAMDGGVLAEMQRRCPEHRRDRLRLFMDFSRLKSSRDVPDPYYGSDDGFSRVLDMVEEGAAGVVEACLAMRRA